MLTHPATSLAAVPPALRPAPESRLAIVSTYPPRPCGIATFTHDLRQGLASAAPEMEVTICALDRDGLHYGPDVDVVVDQDDPVGYRRAAERLAASGVDAVLIQHEFGIFGGPHGAFIDDFAAALSTAGIPYLVTLHTVLSKPTPLQARTLRRLCRAAAGVCVFTPTARRLAIATGIANAERLHVVPHGAPPVLYTNRHGADRQVRPEISSALADLAGATVVSTFGLISANKGLETAIGAVARLADKVPDLCYIIAGATHPEIARHHGERYREHLHRLADEHRVADRITFLDHFLTDEEIAAVLDRTAVFLTPYRSREQISSGALTFALAAGVPAVSTDYHYASDMLSGGAGHVVPCGDGEAFTDALGAMLTEPGRLAKATAAARAAGDRLAWPAIAARLTHLIRSAAASRPASAWPRPVRHQAVLNTA